METKATAIAAVKQELHIQEWTAQIEAVYAVARTAPARTSNRTLPHFEPHFAGA